MKAESDGKGAVVVALLCGLQRTVLAATASNARLRRWRRRRRRRMRAGCRCRGQALVLLPISLFSVASRPLGHLQILHPLLEPFLCFFLEVLRQKVHEPDVAFDESRLELLRQPAKHKPSRTLTAASRHIRIDVFGI